MAPRRHTSPMTTPLLAVLVLLIMFLAAVPAAATQPVLPLKTDSRWIVDQDGRRVKLACANWAAHLQTMVAEGLSNRPVDSISELFGANGFNCVRLTWPLYLLTNDTLGAQTVRQSFQSIDGLAGFIPGFQANNPSFLDISLIDAFKGVVSSLATSGVMIILDNHVTKPQWCCSANDGNGFFGDPYFDPGEWLTGLTRMATMFHDNPNVVGMSLRNELRGARLDRDVWYMRMQQGAEAVHAANRHILVILSGLNFDNDLSFLRQRAVNVSFSEKLMYELHWYRFTDTQMWASGDPGQACDQVSGSVMSRAGFLLESGFPLFLSEFGRDLSSHTAQDDNYMSCFMGLAAKLDFDWALWTLVGSYYIRSGTIGMEESFGLLNANWTTLRDPIFVQRLSAIQQAFQGPGQSNASVAKLIFHPATGHCVRKTMVGSLKLGPCAGSGMWTHTADGTLTAQGLCVKARGMGQAAGLGSECNVPDSKWVQGTRTLVLLSNQTADGAGSGVCLGVAPGPGGTVVTENCKCAGPEGGDGRRCDPTSQWFTIIDKTTATSKSTSTR